MSGPVAPPEPRAVAFIDGQNLYHHAKSAFGYHFPNYDPIKLHDAVCEVKAWKPFGIRFYTGIPRADKSQMWHGYWSNRLLSMRRAGIMVTTRHLRYRDSEVPLPDGTILLDEQGKPVLVNTPQEKGIDVRLALDVIRLALAKQFDVGVIYSQDQDLAEIVSDVKQIARTQNRWIKIACAFPSGPHATASRGIDKAEWVPMDRTLYDACLDPHDYRPKKATI